MISVSCPFVMKMHIDVQVPVTEKTTLGDVQKSVLNSCRKPFEAANLTLPQGVQLYAGKMAITTDAEFQAYLCRSTNHCFNAIFEQAAS